MSNDGDRDFGGNQGEGNREAAKAYNEDTKSFVEAGKVDESAAEAKEAVEGPEKAELDEAEKVGLEKAKAYDPAGKSGK